MSTVPAIDQQAVKLGSRSRLAYAAETAYGERAEPTRSFEFRAGETLAHARARLESEEMRGTELQPGWGEGGVGVGGDVTYELKNKSFGLLFEHAFGDVASAQPDATNAPSVWDHTFTFGDLAGLSLTGQLVRDDLPFDYTGLKVAELQLSCAVDQFALVRTSFLGRAELADQAPHVSAFPTDVSRMTFVHGGLLIAGTEVATNNAQLTLSNGLNAERRRLGSAHRRNPQRESYRNLTGELNCDFTNLNLYNRFVTGEEALLELVFTGGPIGGTAFDYELVWAANVRFDGQTPPVESAGEIRQPLTVKAFPSTGLPEGTELVYRTDDSTP